MVDRIKNMRITTEIIMALLDDMHSKTNIEDVKDLIPTVQGILEIVSRNFVAIEELYEKTYDIQKRLNILDGNKGA